MIEKGVSHIAYFRLDGGSSKLYTQEYVDGKDKEIERLHSIIKEVRELCLMFASGRLERTNYDDILEILDKVDKDV